MEIQPYHLVGSSLVLSLRPKKIAPLIARKACHRSRTLVKGNLEMKRGNGFRIGCRIVGIDVDRCPVIFVIDIVSRNPAVAGLVIGVEEVVRTVTAVLQLTGTAIDIINDVGGNDIPIGKTIGVSPGDIFLTDASAQTDRHLSAGAIRSGLSVCKTGSKTGSKCNACQRIDGRPRNLHEYVVFQHR